MTEGNYWTRIFRKRMTRRALLGTGAAAALGTAGVALVGCEGGGGGAPGTVTPVVGESPVPAGTPRPGGILKAGRSTPVTGLDPHTDLFGLDIVAQMYSFLYSLAGGIGSEEVVLNNLATNMERPDDLTFIFTLRPGVKFHSRDPIIGQEVTPEDVQASFTRRSTAITAIDKRFPMLIEKTEVMPGGIFRIVTKQPFVPAIPEMANPTWGIIPKQIAEEFPSGGLTSPDNEFGSGPFMLDVFRGSERIAVKKHPEFFVPDRPLLDGREWIVIQDNSSLLTAFRSGQHDINGAILDKRLAEDLEKEEGIVVNKVPNLFYTVIQFKVSKPPFNDPRVREAVDLAINRDEIIERIGLGEGFYNGPIQWPQEKWTLPQDELRQLFPHDPERAKALLKEAGFDELSVTVQMAELAGPQVVTDVALVVKAQLERANIKMEPRFVELGAFLTTVLVQGNFDMTFFVQLPYGEPDRPLSFYHSKGVTGQGNWTGLNRTLPGSQQAGFDPEIDDLIDAQQREFDEERRQQIILDVQRKIIREHGPQITLTGGFGYAASWDYVEAAGPTPWDIWLDRA